jgi:ubiquinone/menaquinone biosynthesis C-methylase UbiE
LVFPTDPLSPGDAAVFETFVVSRYLKWFGDLAVDMFLGVEGARVAHLGCRTGYPDTDLARSVAGLTLYGVDSSTSALEIARHKGRAVRVESLEYLAARELPAPLPSAVFSHALALHPVLGVDHRGALLAEMSRLLYPGGQSLLALPLRGSFQEITDLFREYALKTDNGDFSRGVEEAAAGRPTIESLSEEHELVGLGDVDVEIRHTELEFDNGRALIEDPVCRLLIFPEIQAGLGDLPLQKPLEYVRDAIDKYWSASKFELTVNVGCASARRVE